VRSVVPYDPVALKVYTDGSCLRNPGGRGGIAGIVEYPDGVDLPPEPIFERGYYSTTNNRMELRAVIQALEFIASEGARLRVRSGVIYTDSLYVYEGSTLALYRQGGQAANREGRPLANPDLWKEFLRARFRIPFRVPLKWFPGKSTPLLRQVDKLAKKAATIPTETDYGYRPGTVAHRFTPGRSAATAFPAQGQSATIRIYGIRAYKTQGEWQNRVVFDLYSEADRDYVVTHFAYVRAEETSHRNKCYSVTFNESGTYPRIVMLKELPVCPERRRDLAQASTVSASTSVPKRDRLA
jgi:ribonuclease HI